jgi:hypothetical protein
VLLTIGSTRDMPAAGFVRQVLEQSVGRSSRGRRSSAVSPPAACTTRRLGQGAGGRPSPLPAVVQRSGQPETENVVPGDAVVPKVGGRAEGLRRVNPATAAEDTKTFIPTVQPGASVYRRAAVVVMPDIFAPLRDVTVHIVEAPWIAFEAADWHRGFLPLAFNSKKLLQTGPAVIVGLIWRDR